MPLCQWSFWAGHVLEHETLAYISAHCTPLPQISPKLILESDINPLLFP